MSHATEEMVRGSDDNTCAKDDRKPYEGVLGDTSELRIIEHLMSLPNLDFNITEIARSAQISRPAADKVVKKFARWGVVEVLPKRGNMTFYKLNEGSAIVNSVSAFNDVLTLEMFPQLKKTPGPKRKGTSREGLPEPRIQWNVRPGAVSGTMSKQYGPAQVLATSRKSNETAQARVPIALGARRNRRISS